jgi:pyruvate dehydrogenase E2 component (dihydrolipoamide acetyltransferase)
MEMPKLSDTMKEGVVGKWLKKEGDKITSGAPVVEIETDKATMEFESPASGLLLKILVGDGGTCALNAPIAVIGKEGENWQEALDKYTAKKGGQAPKADAKKAPPAAAAPPAPPAQTVPAKSAPLGIATPPGKATAAASSVPAMAAGAVLQSTGTDGRLRASPLARRMAADKGINLADVAGSGPGGRIVQRDIETFAPGIAASTGGGASASYAAASVSMPAGGVERVPLTNMRKIIAQRLTESTQTNPAFYLTICVNMGPLLAWRKGALAKLPDDKKFSVNDLLVFLTARALRKHPDVNASWQGDHIAKYHFVNMAVAVAVPSGLITPVVRNADSIGLSEVARQTKDLIKRARDGKLAPDEYQGGTFSISNLGMNGIEEFTSIINPPQAGILAIGATIPTPVVNAKGEIVVEERMRVTMTCDHRVIDGAVGSEFLKTLKAYLEDPVSALFQL